MSCSAWPSKDPHPTVEIWCRGRQAYTDQGDGTKSAALLHAQTLEGVTRPAHHLEGRDPATGQFRTAKAKEYPTALCRGLIVTLLDGLRRRSCSEGFAVPQWSSLGEQDRLWLGCVAAMSATSFSSTFLPDYQPNARDSHWR